MFDYYVDESGDWDPWASKVSESVYSDQQDMLGEVFVDSINTVSLTTNMLKIFCLSEEEIILKLCFICIKLLSVNIFKIYLFGEQKL